MTEIELAFNGLRRINLAGSFFILIDHGSGKTPHILTAAAVASVPLAASAPSSDAEEI